MQILSVQSDGFKSCPLRSYYVPDGRIYLHSVMAHEAVLDDVLVSSSLLETNLVFDCGPSYL